MLEVTSVSVVAYGLFQGTFGFYSCRSFEQYSKKIHLNKKNCSNVIMMKNIFLCLSPAEALGGMFVCHRLIVAGDLFKCRLMLE